MGEVVSFMNKPRNAYFMTFSYICLFSYRLHISITPVMIFRVFHSVNIRSTTEIHKIHSKIDQEFKCVLYVIFIVLLLFMLTSCEWLQDRLKYVGAKNKKHIQLNNILKRAFVCLCMNDKLNFMHGFEHTKFMSGIFEGKKDRM
jgi:hypothetical protein